MMGFECRDCSVLILTHSLLGQRAMARQSAEPATRKRSHLTNKPRLTELSETHICGFLTEP
jgi:hypothetical protein